MITVMHLWVSLELKSLFFFVCLFRFFSPEFLSEKAQSAMFNASQDMLSDIIILARHAGPSKTTYSKWFKVRESCIVNHHHSMSALLIAATLSMSMEVDTDQSEIPILVPLHNIILRNKCMLSF